MSLYKFQAIYLTFVKAVILILKHASFLMQSSLASELALTHAGLDYQEADINFKIQQYLKASSLWHLFQNYAKFIMATDIGVFIVSFLTVISHQSSSIISALVSAFGSNTRA
ncbi:hypothetical protein EI94DRAFT_425813 [Lactarius quietus]|nr:hypothetical protein EI94DRAFT_425813 [Lactarius quietus]